MGRIYSQDPEGSEGGQVSILESVVMLLAVAFGMFAMYHNGYRAGYKKGQKDTEMGPICREIK